jgi:hypothetical protein
MSAFVQRLIESAPEPEDETEDGNDASLLAFGTACCALADHLKRKHERERRNWDNRMRYGK